MKNIFSLKTSMLILSLKLLFIVNYIKSTVSQESQESNN